EAGVIGRAARLYRSDDGTSARLDGELLREGGRQVLEAHAVLAAGRILTFAAARQLGGAVIGRLTGRQRYLASGTVAHDAELHLLADLMSLNGAHHFIASRDLATVDAGDDVTHLQPGASGWATGQHLIHQHALLYLELRRHLGRDLLEPDAD